MNKSFSAALKSLIIIGFAFSTVPVFAQHSGGGHGGGGGGFHGGGGGGFHGGGGGMRSSGGSATRGGSFSPPAAGNGMARSSAPSSPAGPSRFPNGFANRPGNNFSRPGGNFANRNERVRNSAATPGTRTDGQWHSFGGTHGAAGAPSSTGAANSAGGFHTFSGNRGTAPNTARSFSGQGGDVWENSPAARNLVPKSQSLSTLHNSFVGSRAAGSGLLPNASLSASSRVAAATAFAGSRGFSGGGLNASRPVQPLRGTNRFGVPFGGNRVRCWNCGNRFGGWGSRRGWGIGSGWGLGFGWGGFGFWSPFVYDPFFYNPWWGSGPWLGYGDGYPSGYVYSDPGYYDPDYNSAPPASQQQPADQDNSYDESYQRNTNGDRVTPNEPSASSARHSQGVTVPVLIYMKSGKILSVRDYWMVDDELHYVLMGGTQNSVELEQVDLPRTNTENAKSGVKFIFKSEPSAAPPPPEPAPTQELNAVPEPQATT
jgi:hypothetical protein